LPFCWPRTPERLSTPVRSPLLSPPKRVEAQARRDCREVIGKLLSPSRRRACIDLVRCQFKVSERRVCRVPGQHRSTQRRLPKGRADEERLVADMIELTRQYGRYGYRRIAALLRDAGWQVNDKRVERLWRREGLKVPMKQPNKDVCVMAFFGLHDLSSRVFQSAVISAGGFALSVCVMRLLRFVCLR